jgi:EAL domain-containing protein (putative c-di-GMP-specific phosphodiesterase class I)
LIPPSRFLYIAERSELITRIDEWVVAKAIALLAQVREVVPDFRLEVNLSGHSIGSSSLEGRITESLARHGVPAHALVLEITETVAVADVGLARQFAQRMAALGCRFALDDFGAGFGSFYYLKHLVFDYVKIDGEFVASVHNSMVDRTIMRSIVGIARDLGKQTVAEFVSGPEILEVVRAEGVDYAQGYLIGKPMMVDELIERLTA